MSFGQLRLRRLVLPDHGVSERLPNMDRLLRRL